jgi:hypothetical protein
MKIRFQVFPEIANEFVRGARQTHRGIVVDIPRFKNDVRRFGQHFIRR